MCVCFVIFWPIKLALRAGNEKEEGETADTVGCCSLRVEHITLHEKLEGNECVVEFDFLGKDSIRYYNKVPVIKKVKHQKTRRHSLIMQETVKIDAAVAEKPEAFSSSASVSDNAGCFISYNKMLLRLSLDLS